MHLSREYIREVVAATHTHPREEFTNAPLPDTPPSLGQADGAPGCRGSRRAAAIPPPFDFSQIRLFGQICWTAVEIRI